MNDPDKRERQFVVRGKREYDYDAPAVRRRQTLREREEEEERLDKEERLSRGRVKSRSRREDYEEEELPRRTRKAPPVEEDEIEDDYYEEEEHKAPRIVRIFAWIALMVILFACGYLATNYFFSWSDKKGGERIGNVYGKGAEVKEAEKPEPEKPAGKKYVICIPENGTLSQREVEINESGTKESMITRLLSVYIDSLKEKKVLDTAVAVNDIFQGGDWLYIDMTPPFQNSLKSLGKQNAELLLCGLTKTVQDNFPPLKKIKFYINSKEIKDKNPVDLTKPWERTK